MNLAPIFSNGMVLQANKPIRIFGTGGGNVRIDFCGRRAEYVSGDREWLVSLPPMDYGGPYEMTVDLDGRVRTIRDVWIGDVYLLGGQSNMQFKLRESDYPKEKYETAPAMRLFNLERMAGGERFFPEDGWVACERETAGDWSCLGYLTGRFLARSRDRAIGLIDLSQGAAAIQAFLPDRVFRDETLTVPEDERFDMAYPWNRGHSTLYRYMFRKIVPFSASAVVWYQGESNCSDKESRLYGRMLKALIDEWRVDLADADLPFVIVQIADYLPRAGEAWSRIQRAQAEASAWRNVQTVECRDVCENNLIHPTHKTELARRIARALDRIRNTGENCAMKAIIVLGHRLNPDCTPSKDLISRIDKAVEYWKQSGIPIIMPCGGITRDRARSEAEVMREMLLARGVPEEAIQMENQSRTTSENMENAVKLLGKGARVAMVTSEYHIEYALAECRYHGLDATPVPAPTEDETYRERERKACAFFMHMNAIIRDEAKKQGMTPDELTEKLKKQFPTRESFMEYIAKQAGERGIELPKAF